MLEVLWVRMGQKMLGVLGGFPWFAPKDQGTGDQGESLCVEDTTFKPGKGSELTVYSADTAAYLGDMRKDAPAQAFLSLRAQILKNFKIA